MMTDQEFRAALLAKDEELCRRYHEDENLTQEQSDDLLDQIGDIQAVLYFTDWGTP